jgi:hypothetical protein
MTPKTTAGAAGGSTCSTANPGDAVLPPWYGPAAAGALRWAAAEGAAMLDRLVLVSLALIADDDGLIGCVSDLAIANLTGQPTSEVIETRRFLIKRRALIEADRGQGQEPALFIGRPVLDAIPSHALLDTAAARPAAPPRRSYRYRKVLATRASPTEGQDGAGADAGLLRTTLPPLASLATPTPARGDPLPNEEGNPA